MINTRKRSKTLPVISKNDGQRNKKPSAMFEKNTGNVFQNDEQCFGKLRAMLFSGFRKLLFVHLFVVPRGEIPQ